MAPVPNSRRRQPHTGGAPGTQPPGGQVPPLVVGRVARSNQAKDLNNDGRSISRYTLFVAQSCPPAAAAQANNQNSSAR